MKRTTFVRFVLDVVQMSRMAGVIFSGYVRSYLRVMFSRSTI